MAGHRLRRLTVATLGVAVAGIAVLGFAAPAQAHDAVIASTPAEGETLTVLPAEFSVTANATFLDLVGDGTGFGFEVKDAAGLFYGDGCVSIVDATMTTPASLGAAGSYTLTYQYVSSDSHPTSGTINFVWAPAAGFEPAAGRSTAPVCGEAEPTPEPTMSTQETPAETPSPSATAATEASDADESTSTLLWIGGAGLAVVAAVVVTLLLVRPKKRDDAGQ